MWTIEYTNTSRKQLKKLDRSVASRVLHFFEERVVREGAPFAHGHALTGEWLGYWRYRVGDYRIICKIREERLIIAVIRVGHRSNVYDR